MKHALAALLPALLAGTARAHEGHGLTGLHAHGWDAWGFAALGLIGAAAWWFARRK